MSRCQRRVVEAEAAHDARPVVFDEDIGGGDETPHDLLAASGAEIQHDAALAAIDGIEAGALDSRRASHPPRRIAAGRLDLDHVCAHVA